MNVTFNPCRRSIRKTLRSRLFIPMTASAYQLPVVSGQWSVARMAAFSFVILSGGTASQSEAGPQSKDPYTVLSPRAVRGILPAQTEGSGTFSAPHPYFEPRG